ncbi:MAG: efflux RND transporter periplasmic adaptor subunit [Planctomycetota bacterium]
MKFLLVITGLLFASGSMPQPGLATDPTFGTVVPQQHSGSDSSNPQRQNARPQPTFGLSARVGVGAAADAIHGEGDHLESIDLLMLPGVAQPSRRVEISPALDGVMATVIVREGQYVKAGQELGRLNDTVARAALASAKSTALRRGAIEQAEGEVETAARQVARLEKIDKIGAVPEVDLDEARARHAKALAAVLTANEDATRAQRLLELEEARLGQYRVLAPFDGVLTRLVAEPGAAQNSQSDFGTLVSLAELYIDLHLPIEYFGQLKVGDRRLIAAGAPVYEDLEATLLSIDPLIDPATRTFRCRFQILNPQLRLPAGFTALLKL